MEVNKPIAPTNNQPSVILPKESKFRIIEDYDGVSVALTRIVANNVSQRPLDRIEVYSSGRENPILSTNIEGGFASHFSSAIKAPVPYTLTTVVNQGGKISSGELTIHTSGVLDIDIEETTITMKHYTDRERATLIASQALTPKLAIY